MKKAAAAFCLLLALIMPVSAMTAELIFVQWRGCSYCQSFNRQMANKYRTSELGKMVPLRPVDVFGKWPEDLKAVDRPPYTPVFILVDRGREIGRFNGYANPAQFKRELRGLLARGSQPRNIVSAGAALQ